MLPSGAAETFGFGLTVTPPPLGSQISATATSAAGDTSEFSACVPLQEGTNALVVTNTAESGAGSLRQAMIDANANADASVIAFNIPGVGPHTISPLTSLPEITAPVLIDGYTQPGAVANSLAVGDDAVIKVRIDGFAGGVGTILPICADDVTIRGLALTRAAGNAIGVGVGSDGLNCVAVQRAIVEGNFIGLTPDGTTAAPNGNGVQVRRGSDTRVGGEAPAQRNLISSNVSVGVSFANSSSGGGVVCNNYIGTDRTGLLDRGNAFGVLVSANAPSAQIGCAAPNRIAFNDRGIAVGATSSSVDAHANDVFSNAELGIDLTATGNFDGNTANDPNDVDTGGNGLQNFPVIAQVGVRNGALELSGSLDVATNVFFALHRIAVYENGPCDTGGRGEGEVLLGSANVRLSNSTESFTVVLGNPPAPGAIVTATATDPNGNTSEFSTCATVVELPLFANGFE